jgi:exodeoxyribonuclease VII small subunit
MSEPVRIDPSAVPFEALLERLGDVVTRLESGDLPLEAALGVFEEGVVLARAGARRLDEAERRVEQLLAEGDRLVTRPIVGTSGTPEENVE